MNTTIKLATLISLFALFTGCQEDLDDQFNNANNISTMKYASRFQIIDQEDNYPVLWYDFYYDNNDRLIRAEVIDDLLDISYDGVLLSYSQQGNIESATSGNQTHIASDFLNSIIEMKEVSITGYDQSGNPNRIERYEYGIGSQLYEYEIEYDSNPYALFPMLENSGLLDYGDNLDFSLSPQGNPFLALREMVPFNNPEHIEVREKNGPIIHDVNLNYSYDADGYPSSAIITHYNSDTQELFTYDLLYFY